MSRSITPQITALVLLGVMAGGCRGVASRGAALSCPPGATLMGSPPPSGQEVWCQAIVDGKPVKNGLFIVYGGGGGKMIEGEYRDGVQEGEWRMWYENGHLAALDHYRHGLQEGSHVSWYANGQKSIEGDYRAGRREGLWTSWDPGGLHAVKRRYKDDHVIG